MKNTVKLNESQLRKIIAESIKKALREDATHGFLYGKKEMQTINFWVQQVSKNYQEFNRLCQAYSGNPQKIDYAKRFIEEMDWENGGVNYEDFYLSVGIYLDIRSLKDLAEEWADYIEADENGGYDDQYFADMEPEADPYGRSHTW